MTHKLQEDLFKDLDNVVLREVPYLNCYLRDFVARAYTGTPTMNMPNISLYIKENGLEFVKKELRSLVYLGENILDINKLFDNIANEQLKVYCEKRNLFQTNVEIDLNAAVIEEIQNLNLNNGRKEYLMKCFNEENYRELEGLISDRLFLMLIEEAEEKQSIGY